MAVQQYISDKFVGLSTDVFPTGVAVGADFYALDTATHYILSGEWRMVTGGLTITNIYTLSGSGELITYISGALTATGVTLHNEILGLSGVVSTYYLPLSQTGQFSSSGNLYNTGSNLYNQITGLSGTIDYNRSYITGLSVTGVASALTGLVTIRGTGLSSVLILGNNTILISGISNASTVVPFNVGSGLIPTGEISTFYIPFAQPFTKIPIICSQILRVVDTDPFIMPDITGVTPTGFWLSLTDSPENGNYYYNYIACTGSGYVEIGSGPPGIQGIQGIPGSGLAGPAGPAGGVTGSGIINYLAKWIPISGLGNSQIFDNGTRIGVQNNNPQVSFDISGKVRMISGLGIGNFTPSDGYGLQIQGLQNSIFNLNSTLPTLWAGATSSSGNSKIFYAGTNNAASSFQVTQDAAENLICTFQDSNKTGFLVNKINIAHSAFLPNGDALIASQQITIRSTKTKVLGNGGAVILTSTPTISDGAYDGQIVYLQGCNNTNTITIQDETALAGSNLQLGAPTRILGSGDILGLMFDTTNGYWHEF